MNDQIQLLLLEILSQAIGGQDHICPETHPDTDVLRELIEGSIHHSVFPLVVDVLLQNRRDMNGKTTDINPGQMLDLYRNEVIHQSRKTADFLLFYEYLNANNLHPLVLKGIICRNLYPEPEHRASSDEDLLIDPAEFSRYHDVILSYGLTLVDPTTDIWNADEVSYESKDHHLYIEVHKSLFDTRSNVFADLNRYFEEIRKHSITMDVYGTTFHTPDHTDHLLYLFLHAFKHLIYSGFGIRQVCDIILFSEHYREEIDWTIIKEQLHNVSALEFAKAIFKIGDQHLLKDNHMKEYLAGWKYEEVDEGPLLADIMDGGIYGVEDINRAHAAHMTLHAVASQKPRDSKRTEKNKRGSTGVWHSLFPGKTYLQNHYSYAKKIPVLLPVAWTHRIIGYLTNDKKNKADPMKSINIGEARIQLLKQYRIIK